jgi:UDP-N-acetyl-D-glucosamine dehydrogenase
MTHQTTLLDRFARRDAHVAIIGLGYVGLPLAVVFADAGYRVTGIDLDSAQGGRHQPRRILHRGCADSRSSGVGATKGACGIKRSLSRLARLCAPPLGCRVAGAPPPISAVLAGVRRGLDLRADAAQQDRRPDISYIVSATEQVARYLHRGMVIVLESTTYPGTTREMMLPRLHENAQGLRVGEDFFLAFSPERVDPGRTDWTTRNTPKVIGGVTPACLEVASAYYSQAIATLVPVSTPEAAEMVKLFENTFRSVNIGLANELLLMCDKLGLDAWEVLDAAATKPFGFMKFTPGPGLGGHCIPIDPLYLSWKLRTLAYTARFIELASEINTEMPRYWVQKVQDVLNDASKAVKGSRMLVLGVAYKKNVSDLRESPALDIIHLLEDKGAHVTYHDPHVPAFAHDGMEMVGVTDLAAALTAADCAVIVTDHDTYDWAGVRQAARLLVDTRHVA